MAVFDFIIALLFTVVIVLIFSFRHIPRILLNFLRWKAVPYLRLLVVRFRYIFIPYVVGKIKRALFIVTKLTGTYALIKTITRKIKK
ncbi:hypothetical protein AB9G23_03590 [Francisella philomiragia]|uniref:hypothetical protein n=1 Tax=Francisella philomiragia TaxID=28110 RepID=UPI0019087953|nr:hypothetical protein [Francisella philomiragia]MBK2026289.1 hypothetical protein [Francisella philomiragia]